MNDNFKLSLYTYYLRYPFLKIEKFGKQISNKDVGRMIPNKFNFVWSTDLCRIMNTTGSDKGGHHYTQFYSSVFNKDKRLLVKNVFEMGIGTNNTNIPDNMGENGKPGASLRGWRKFFPNAQICGADIDKEILFREPRISAYYCDQLNSKSIKNMWKKNPRLSGRFDLIVDDGLHSFKSNTLFFENSIDKLKKGGVYVIEDVHINTFQKWFKIINNLYIKKYPNLIFSILRIPLYFEAFDNNIVAIEKVN